MKPPLFAWALCAFQTALLAFTAPPPDKPNILLILVDDVGYADVGAFAARVRRTPAEELFLETPRLDRLALRAETPTIPTEATADAR